MAFVDHYLVLGLPTGEEGIKLSEREISRAFKRKALKVHPDKRRDVNPETANSDFQKLQQSYTILADATSREQFNATLLQREQQWQRRWFGPEASTSQSRKWDNEEWWQKVREPLSKRFKRAEGEEAWRRREVEERERKKREEEERRRKAREEESARQAREEERARQAREEARRRKMEEEARLRKMREEEEDDKRWEKAYDEAQFTKLLSRLKQILMAGKNFSEVPKVVEVS